MGYELHAEAREELLSAATRYDAEVLGLGRRFIAELERCFNLLVEQPRIGSPYGRRLRRFVIDDGFPFAIVYVPTTDAAFLVAIADTSRRPGYWRYRAAR